MRWVHYSLHGLSLPVKGGSGCTVNIRTHSDYSDTLLHSLGGGVGDGGDGVTQVDGDPSLLTSSAHASCSTGSGRRSSGPVSL